MDSTVRISPVQSSAVESSTVVSSTVGAGSSTVVSSTVVSSAVGSSAVDLAQSSTQVSVAAPRFQRKVVKAQCKSVGSEGAVVVCGKSSAQSSSHLSCKVHAIPKRDTDDRKEFGKSCKVHAIPLHNNPSVGIPSGAVGSSAVGSVAASSTVGDSTVGSSTVGSVIRVQQLGEFNRYGHRASGKGHRRSSHRDATRTPKGSAPTRASNSEPFILTDFLIEQWEALEKRVDASAPGGVDELTLQLYREDARQREVDSQSDPELRVALQRLVDLKRCS